jgi:hypothetical protein
MGWGLKVAPALFLVRLAWAVTCRWKSCREEMMLTLATGKGSVARRGPKEARFEAKPSTRGRRTCQESAEAIVATGTQQKSPPCGKLIKAGYLLLSSDFVSHRRITILCLFLPVSASEQA